jgi:hypothetical protein
MRKWSSLVERAMRYRLLVKCEFGLDASRWNCSLVYWLPWSE